MTRASGIAASLALAGCSTLVEVNAGPVVALPTRDDASFGGAASLHSGIGSSSEGARRTVGVDVNAKLKATSVTQQIAFGQGFYYAAGPALMRAGLHLAFERYDEKLLVGGGPYAALLGAIPLDSREYFVPGGMFAHARRDRTLLTLGPTAEIDARFSRPSAVTFVGLAVGIAWASEVLENKPQPIGVPPPRRPPQLPWR